MWLYVGGLLSSFLGYVYWLIASSFILPPIVGSAAAITSIPILLLSSLITYTRLGIVTRSDLLEVLQAFLSEESISKIYLYTRSIVRLMYGE